MFVISLATSDLLFCSFNLPIIVSEYASHRAYQDWLHGTFMCRLYPFFFYGNCGASISNLCTITINRYVLICHNGIYKKIFSGIKIALIILFTWLFPFAIMSLPLFEIWGQFGLWEDGNFCNTLEKDGHHPGLFIMVCAFGIPFITIIVCYSRIFLEVRKMRRELKVKHCNSL